MGPPASSAALSARLSLPLHPPRRRRRQQRMGAAAALLAVAGAAVLVLQGDDVPANTFFNTSGSGSGAIPSSRLVGNKRKLTTMSLKGSTSTMTTHQNQEHGSPPPPPVPSYTTRSIVHIQRQLQRSCLLLFDGQSGKFHIYTPIATMRGRYQLPATLLINALRNYYPERLERGQANLQILFSADDCIELRCLEYDADGNANANANVDDDNNHDHDHGNEYGRYDHLFTDECRRVEQDTLPDGTVTSPFAPVLAFDSVPVHYRELFGGRAIRPMPLPQWLGCFQAQYFDDAANEGGSHGGNDHGDDNDKCHLLPHLSDEVLQRKWEDLVPQLFWRGSDFPSSTYAGVAHSGRASDVDVVDLGEREGLHAPADAVEALRQRWEVLSPRWRAVAMSLEARTIDIENSEGDENNNNNNNNNNNDDEESQEAEVLPWIDARFKVRPERTPFYEPHYFGASTEEHTDASAQAGHRYYLDLGGGGGTTWQGTLNMLYFPGLLFHHETLTKDFFHDEMKPYEHYVPVKMDLSDLREKFDWAESHPEEAQRIAKAATELAIKLASAKYVQELFDNLFLATLGKMVGSYRPEEGETIESILQTYEEAGVPFHDMGECNVGECNWNFGGGISKLFVGDGGGGASAVA